MIRNSFSRGRHHSRKEIAARKFGRPMLEILEDRLAPAMVSLAGEALSFTAGSVAETITVTEPAPNTLDIAITGTTDTISLGSGTDSNFVVTNTSSSSSLQISNVNSGAKGSDSIGFFDVFLPSSPSFSDTLNFGLADNSASAGIISVNISGPNGPTGPTTDSTDTVMLNSLPNLASLSVSAETINFQDPVDLVYGSAFLTSVNSLTFPSTGVPYLGAVTLNATPPAGQPFAGDTSITGPDWGAYGYEPGDQITISGATNVPTTPYSVAGIVGDNLYVTPALPSSALPPNQVNDSDVTVACAGFTPELEAYALSLNVTGTGKSISGAIQATFLQGSTQSGNITLQDTAGGLAVGPLNAGTGTIQLDVNGPIDGTDGIPAPPVPGFVNANASTVDLTAGALDLAITESGGSIGAVDPLHTAIDGELTATTNDGGVTIVDQGTGLTINSIVADQGGQGPVVSNGQIVYNSTPSVSLQLTLLETKTSRSAPRAPLY